MIDLSGLMVNVRLYQMDLIAIQLDMAIGNLGMDKEEYLNRLRDRLEKLIDDMDSEHDRGKMIHGYASTRERAMNVFQDVCDRLATL